MKVTNVIQQPKTQVSSMQTEFVQREVQVFQLQTKQNKDYRLVRDLFFNAILVCKAPIKSTLEWGLYEIIASKYCKCATNPRNVTLKETRAFLCRLKWFRPLNPPPSQHSRYVHCSPSLSSLSLSSLGVESTHFPSQWVKSIKTTAKNIGSSDIIPLVYCILPLRIKICSVNRQELYEFTEGKIIYRVITLLH